MSKEPMPVLWALLDSSARPPTVHECQGLLLRSKDNIALDPEFVLALEDQGVDMGDVVRLLWDDQVVGASTGEVMNIMQQHTPHLYDATMMARQMADARAQRLALTKELECNGHINGCEQENVVSSDLPCATVNQASRRRRM